MAARYDAAIIGANPDGLAAAAMLAKAGLKTVVVERAGDCGGLASTREFHPGFRASPFMDELPAIPAEIFWALDLARRGAIFVPATTSTAIWPDGRSILNDRAPSRTQAHSLLTQGALLGRRALSRAAAESLTAPRPVFAFLNRTPRSAPWPGEEWLTLSMSDLLARTSRDPREMAHVAAIALGGRPADPFLAGSALHLLAARGGGIVMGGLGRLADALVQAANASGAEIRCGIETGDLLLKKGGVAGLALTDGSEIETRAVISTLDLKRTFLSLFQWNALSKPLVARVNAFRMAGGMARVLLALDRSPKTLPQELLRGTVQVAPEMERFADAHFAWRTGSIPTEPPVALRLASAMDPGLAPAGAVLTATLGAIPFRLFDGPWTKEKRDVLRDRALASAEMAMPGVTAHVVAAEVITPSDMEAALSATDGDLWGGEIAVDQMFGFRPWEGVSGARTPIWGLYLGGPSSVAGPLGTCAAGWQAAHTLLADVKAGRLR